MSVYVVTGAESGIGAATAARLRRVGHRVIGVDRSPSDVTADLSTKQGRRDALTKITDLAPGGVAGIVPCAGVPGLTGADSALVVSVNYFGAIEMLEGLHPLMVKAAEAGSEPAVVLISSNSVTCQPGWATEVADQCLAGDEENAQATAGLHEAVHVYPATKAALAWWMRREGVTPRWIGSGIRINAVAPGLIATAMTNRLREDPELGVFADTYPSAVGRPGRPDEVANTIAFLMSGEASLIVGSTVFVDGGTDAIMHPRQPTPM